MFDALGYFTGIKQILGLMDLVFRVDKSFDCAVALNIVIHLLHPGNPLIRLTAKPSCTP